MNHRIVIGTVVTLVALIATVSGVLYAQTNNDPNAELDPLIVAQMPLSNAADKIYALWDSDGLSDFGGISLDNENSAVVLYWKGGRLPSQMSTLVADLRSTVTIRVVNTTYSLAEFQAESKRLIEQGRVGTVVVNRAGPSPDFSSLKVGIDTNVDEPDADKLAAAQRSITSVMPLDFSVAKTLDTFRRRWDDEEPFYGGAAIDKNDWWSPVYDYCTTGFAVTTSSGTEGLLTAAHCGYGESYYTPDGDQYVGTVSNPISCIYDAGTLIGRNYDPRVYAGSWSSGRSLGVIGSVVPTVGQYVYMSGSWSGEHMTRVVSTFEYTSGCYPWAVGPGFWTEDQQGDGSVGDGDSGGPVYRYVSGSTVRGAGIIRGGDTINYQAPCEGRTASWRSCASRAFHMHLPAVLSGLNVTLQTQ